MLHVCRVVIHARINVCHRELLKHLDVLCVLGCHTHGTVTYIANVIHSLLRTTQFVGGAASRISCPLQWDSRLLQPLDSVEDLVLLLAAVLLQLQLLLHCTPVGQCVRMRAARLCLELSLQSLVALAHLAHGTPHVRRTLALDLGVCVSAHGEDLVDRWHGDKLVCEVARHRERRGP